MTKKRSNTLSKTMTCATCNKVCPVKPGGLCYECNRIRILPKYRYDPREEWLDHVLREKPGKGTKRKRRKKRKGGSRRTGRRFSLASRRR